MDKTRPDDARRGEPGFTLVIVPSRISNDKAHLQVAKMHENRLNVVVSKREHKPRLNGRNKS